VLAAALVGLVIWVLQDLGEIFTGQGTDPNSGLLLFAVAAAFWPLTIAPGTRSADRS